MFSVFYSANIDNGGFDGRQVGKYLFTMAYRQTLIPAQPPARCLPELNRK